MTPALDVYCWPLAMLGEAICALAERSDLSPRAVAVPEPPIDLLRTGDNVPLERWIEGTAGWLGVEAELIEVRYAELSQLVRAAGPSLLRLQSKGSLFLAVLRGESRYISILCPNRSIVKVPMSLVCEELTREEAAPMQVAVDRLVVQAGISPSRRARVADALLGERFRNVLIRRFWQFRSPLSAPIARQGGRGSLFRRLALYAGAHGAAYTLWVSSWWVIGKGAFQDRLDAGWLLAWGLMIITFIPCRLIATWKGGLLGIEIGALLKQKLLAGILALMPGDIRRKGAGQLLGQVMESSELESLALDGGLAGLTAGIEISVAVAVLCAGAGGWLHGVLLGTWVIVTLALGWRYLRRRSRWTGERLSMTDDLVERLVGHRTRLAQESPKRWHDGEDQALDRYFKHSQELDQSLVPLAAIPRGWLILGMLGIALPFASGSVSPATLAVGVGGILLGQRALATLVTSLAQIAGALVAWGQVRAVYQAGARLEVPRPPPPQGRPAGEQRGTAPLWLLEARGIAYSHAGRPKPVLDGCDFKVQVGERILLEGSSGSGKSTLSSLVAGLEVPTRGLMLLRGLDWQTLGLDGWRACVVAAPQFHENHIFSNTLAFNLLMGRNWPPRPGDLELAEALCRRLKLGELIERMPAGMQQIVGEMGWQLSHGERSRIYIARALLQEASLVILDESFAALDPETLQITLRCVIDEAPTLIVIAHP